jgi:hypothetical protein
MDETFAYGWKWQQMQWSEIDVKLNPYSFELAYGWNGTTLPPKMWMKWPPL